MVQGTRNGGVGGAAQDSSQNLDVLQIARTVAATIGADFFRAIAKHLATALAADCVLLGEFVGGPMEGVKTLAAYLDGVPTSFEYELAGSASAVVAMGRPCACRAKAQSRFPADNLLPMVDAQALIAVPLLDSQRQPIGLIMALYRHPVESFQTAKQLLDIFSARAAAELNRKREEDQLRQSEQRYRAFIATNTDGMWRVELEQPVELALPAEEQLARIQEFGYLAECNDALARFMGRETAQQVLGSRVKDLEISADPDMRASILRAIQTGYDHTTVEVSRLDDTGHRRHFLRCHWGIVEDGKLRRIWGTTRDITQLRHSERALDASEQRMADLLETLQLVVVIVNPQGAVAFCNNYFYRTTGWTPSDVLGKDWLVLMVPSDEHSRLRSTFGDEVTRPEVPIHFDSNLLGPDMRRWQYEWDRAALCDAEGNVAAWANVGRDVTEKRALEEQFLRAQKLATIGKLAAGIAHDFNNLLTVIMGYSSALVSRLDPADPAHRDLSEIRKVTAKGAELTNRLLAFGRTQALRPEVLSPNHLIGDAEQMLHRLVGNDVRLTTHLDPLAGLVRLDSSSFHQVLMNLAVNARDAMPNGGELIIATSNVRVDAGSQLFPGVPSGDYVMITVSDTGTGMSEEVRRHLFEPFFTTKQPGKGVGLGLSTVYGVVHQSGGQIFVDSETGRGTTMRILLHRVFREAAPSLTPDVS